MIFNDKVAKRQLSDLTENMTLLCEAVVRVYEKLDSRMNILETKLSSLETKLDQLVLNVNAQVKNIPESRCPIMCAIM